MSFAAILLDLDGTLVDSERESAEAMARVLIRDLGLPIDQADRDYVVGHSWNEIDAWLRAKYGAKMAWTFGELIARSSAERELVIAEAGLTIMQGARELVRRFAHLPRAIVTGSSRAEAAASVAHLGIADQLQFVLASEDMPRGKPFPDGYLAAAERLGVAPARCLVLEDSAAGIAAGRAAGMTVIGVRIGNFLNQDQSAAHEVVETLDHVTAELLARLAGRVA